MKFGSLTSIPLNKSVSPSLCLPTTISESQMMAHIALWIWGYLISDNFKVCSHTQKAFMLKITTQVNRKDIQHSDCNPSIILLYFAEMWVSTNNKLHSPKRKSKFPKFQIIILLISSTGLVKILQCKQEGVMLKDVAASGFKAHPH